MLTVERAREILGDAGQRYSDRDVNGVIALAEVLIEMFIDKIEAERRARKKNEN